MSVVEQRGNISILFGVVILVCVAVLASRWWVMAQRVPIDQHQLQAAASFNPGGELQSDQNQPSVSEPTGMPPLVDINTADQTELMRLPGIGEVLAGRIVAYREQYGSYKRIEDLDGVEGIGAKKLEQLKEMVRVGEPDK